MERLIVHGQNKPLQGTVQISGAKNACLPILAASLLVDGTVKLSHVPQLKDVTTLLELLGVLGACFILGEGMVLEINTEQVSEYCAPLALVKSMRASILVLGPLLGKYGQAKVALPGGCEIGSRPVDIHIQGMRALGADVAIKDGFIEAHAPDGLRGADIHLDTVTVTGTENIMMAAVLAQGKTIIRNAAKEPEVVDLAHFLNAMGAKVQGAGTETITIEGVSQCHGGEYSVMFDRIEAGTFLIAGAMSRGCVKVEGIAPALIQIVLEKLKQTGAVVTQGDDWVAVDMQGRRPKAVAIATGPYPEYPTDLQAQWIALNTVAEGQATVSEHIFENRFMHVLEMRKLGAKIDLDGHSAHVKGQEKLQGALVKATDLRASACLVLCGMVAEGETEIIHIHHIDRGYSYIEEKFIQLGADIRRLPV